MHRGNGAVETHLTRFSDRFRLYRRFRLFHKNKRFTVSGCFNTALPMAYVGVDRKVDNPMVALNRLSAIAVAKNPPGKYADGGGLWFFRRPDGGAQWIFRYTLHGTRHEMGLGSLNTVSLAEARRDAEKWRKVVQEGADPIKERERLKVEAAKEHPTLTMVMADAFEARKAELKADGRAGRWESPLRVHVLPKIGDMPLKDLHQIDIRDTLAPIWHTKPEAAKKALDRLRIIVRYGAAMGLDVDLQAVDKAKALLGAQRRIRRNIAALDWREVPDFYQTLDDGTVTHLAFRLLILTACRSSEIRFCHLDEIQSDTWVIPPERMKAARRHAVPLSNEAQAIIQEAKPFSRGGLLFPGRGKGVISDMTMTALLKRRGMEARPHGFRASFRTWCAEATDTPGEVAEACLAHSISGRVEASYMRTTLLDRRRVLMQRWASFLCSTGADVIEIGGRG